MKGKCRYLMVQRLVSPLPAPAGTGTRASRGCRSLICNMSSGWTRSRGTLHSEAIWGFIKT